MRATPAVQAQSLAYFASLFVAEVPERVGQVEQVEQVGLAELPAMGGLVGLAALLEIPDNWDHHILSGVWGVTMTAGLAQQGVFNRTLLSPALMVAVVAVVREQ